MTYEMLIKLIHESNLSDADKLALYSIDTSNPQQYLKQVREKLLSLSYQAQLDQVRSQLQANAKKEKPGKLKQLISGPKINEKLLQLLDQGNYLEIRKQLEKLKKESGLHDLGLRLLDLAERNIRGETSISIGGLSVDDAVVMLDSQNEEIANDLNSESGKLFAKNLRLLGIEAILSAERNKREALNDLLAILSDASMVKEALRDARFINIPRASKYAKPKAEEQDYLAYITSLEFNSLRDLGGNLGRSAGEFDVFTDEERNKLGYTSAALTEPKDQDDDRDVQVKYRVQLVKALMIANAISRLQFRYLEDGNAYRVKMLDKSFNRKISDNDSIYAERQIQVMQMPITTYGVLKGKLQQIDQVVSAFLRVYLPDIDSDQLFSGGTLVNTDLDAVAVEDLAVINARPYESPQLRQSGFEVVDDEDQRSAEKLDLSASMADEVDSADAEQGNSKEEAGDEAPAVAVVRPQAPARQVNPEIINNALSAVKALYDAKASKQITASELKKNTKAIVDFIKAAKFLLPDATNDELIAKIKDDLSPFLIAVRRELLAIGDLKDVLTGFNAKLLGQIPGYDAGAVESAVLALKQCAAAISQVRTEVYGDTSLDAARKEALKVLLRLQALDVGDELTDEISDFYQAMLRFNATIPGGFDALKFAENLKAVLPRDQVFHSDAMLAKLDKLDVLYQPVAAAGQFKLINMEVYQALDTFKHDESLASNTVAEEDIVKAQNDIQVEDDPKVKGLLAACNEYLLHLGKAIYSEILDADFELCKRLVSRPGPESRLQFDIHAVMNAQGEVKQRIDGMRAKNVTLDLAMKKYQVVSEMKGLLVLDGQPVQPKIDAFHAKFNESRELIETRRDSGAIKFLKAVASVLALVVSAVAGPLAGAALLNKLWKVKGEKKAKEIDQILGDAPKNNNPRK